MLKIAYAAPRAIAKSPKFGAALPRADDAMTTLKKT